MERAGPRAALEILERTEASAAKTDAEMIASIRNFLASGGCSRYGWAELDFQLALAQQAKEEVAVKTSSSLANNRSHQRWISSGAKSPSTRMERDPAFARMRLFRPRIG